MHQTNKEFALEFLRGAAFVFLVTGFFLGFILTLGHFDPAPAQKFVVVDGYEGCDVVKYTPKGKATSEYFLDCRKVR